MLDMQHRGRSPLSTFAVLSLQAKKGAQKVGVEATTTQQVTTT